MRTQGLSPDSGAGGMCARLLSEMDELSCRQSSEVLRRNGAAELVADFLPRFGDLPPCARLLAHSVPAASRLLTSPQGTQVTNRSAEKKKHPSTLISPTSGSARRPPPPAPPTSTTPAAHVGCHLLALPHRLPTLPDGHERWTAEMSEGWWLYSV